MSFDPMAAAIDWLDAYRSRDLEAILKMYADNSVIDCGCGGMTSIIGQAGLRGYWMQRLNDYPASALDDVQPSSDGATISYVSSDRVVSAILEFGLDGLIKHQRCGPTA